LEGTRLLLLYRQLIAAGRSGPAGEVKRRLYQLGLSGSGERVHRTAEKALLYHSHQLLSQRKKGAGASPLLTGTKKAPEGNFAATLRGKG